jgi:Transglutaminase-like enzymes, putative cysteine proteases
MILRSKVTIGKFIIYCILITFLVYVLSASFAGFLAYDLNWKSVVIASVITNVLLYIFYLYPVIDAVAAIALAVFAAVFYMIQRDGAVVLAGRTVNFIAGAFQWFTGYMFGMEKMQLAFASFTMIVYAVLFTLIIFILVVYRHYGLLPLILGVALISTMWYYGYPAAFSYMQLYMIAGFVLYGFINYDRRESGWRLKHDRYSKKVGVAWIVFSTAAILIAFFITNLLPTNIKPISIGWINRYVFGRASNLGPNQNVDIANSTFNISYLGYQETSTRLGGTVKPSNQLFLSAKIEGDVSGAIYLRGTVKDFYDGSMWSKSTIPVISVKNNEQITNIAGNVSKIKETKDIAVTIHPEELNTLSLFNLWQPQSANVPGDGYNCDAGGDLYFQKSSLKKRDYKVVSKVPTVYGDELQTAPGFKTIRAANPNMSQYLQIDNREIPKRVIDLTNQITDKYKTDYEKAVAIEDYLRMNYPYTLETSILPIGKDFVDFFLFEEKKGYCTYFASAMTVMCRLEGIPSRYVEGFILGNPNLGDDGSYKATATQAHAWVELYFDGYGWVTFEPTPNYSVVDYTRPAEVNATTPGDNPDNNNTPDNNQDPGHIDKPVQEEGDNGGSAAQHRNIMWGILAGALLVILVAARMGTKKYTSVKKLNGAEKLEGKDAASEYLTILEKKLSLAGIARGDGETPAEYADRINNLLIDYDIDIKDLMEQFGFVRFGNLPLEKKVRGKLKDAIKKSDKFIKDRKGIFKYILIKYLL